jgi:hypothetical protein
MKNNQANPMTGQKIPLDDQHALMLQHQDLHKGSVHYQPSGYAIQARQVADSILKLLPAVDSKPAP